MGEGVKKKGLEVKKNNNTKWKLNMQTEKSKESFMLIINQTFNTLPEIEVKIWVKSEMPLDQNHSGIELGNFSF